MRTIESDEARSMGSPVRAGVLSWKVSGWCRVGLESLSSEQEVNDMIPAPTSIVGMIYLSFIIVNAFGY